MSVIGSLAVISAVKQLMEHGGGSDTFCDPVMSIVNAECATAIIVKHCGDVGHWRFNLSCCRTTFSSMSVTTFAVSFHNFDTKHCA
jgi:hypothetical protein